MTDAEHNKLVTGSCNPIKAVTRCLCCVLNCCAT